MLEGLSRERFTTLLTNWYRAARGKFKVPIFAHQELDLHRVFWEVMRRGGFPVVTEQKQWKVRRWHATSSRTVLKTILTLGIRCCSAGAWSSVMPCA